MTEKTYIICGLDGPGRRASPRQVTLAEFMAESAAAVARVKPVADAFKRGDIRACAAAQQAARRG